MATFHMKLHFNLKDKLTRQHARACFGPSRHSPLVPVDIRETERINELEHAPENHRPSARKRYGSVLEEHSQFGEAPSPAPRCREATTAADADAEHHVAIPVRMTTDDACFAAPGAATSARTVQRRLGFILGGFVDEVARSPC